ncbi:hypothetical protein NL676_009073 [Syzygium grande]|nr:hypothetical protein NL676_009073 [Syzygium grande]
MLNFANLGFVEELRIVVGTRGNAGGMPACAHATLTTRHLGGMTFVAQHMTVAFGPYLTRLNHTTWTSPHLGLLDLGGPKCNTHLCFRTWLASIPQYLSLEIPGLKNPSLKFPLLETSVAPLLIN